MTTVKITSNKLVLKLKLDDENTLGIIIKITNGLRIPPDKYSKIANCKISITKKMKADLSDN